MAYTGRGSTGSRDGHGWAIAGAFVGQAAIIVGLGVALVTPSTSGGATRMITGPTPAQAAPESAASLAPEVQPLIEFPYQITVDGQSGSGVYVFPRTVPSIVVQPGRVLTVSLDVTIPRGEDITSMSVNLDGDSRDAQFSVPLLTPYNDSIQATAPGTHVFELIAPASEMRSASEWTLFMTVESPGMTSSAPDVTEGYIAQVSVG
jgi:hypothetical protein